jgi:hypothetical protein
MDREKVLNYYLNNEPSLSRLNNLEREGVRKVALAFADKIVRQERENAMIIEVIGFARIDPNQRQINLPVNVMLDKRREFLLERARRFGYTVQRTMF